MHSLPNLNLSDELLITYVIPLTLCTKARIDHTVENKTHHEPMNFSEIRQAFSRISDGPGKTSWNSHEGKHLTRDH